MSHDKEEILEETRAADLLPPDVEPYTPPTKKIGERRVGGWALSQRLTHRRARRPAGNSRKFWARVEDDDPFLPKPDGKRVAQSGGFYPSDRLGRIPDKPKPTRASEPVKPRKPKPKPKPPPKPKPQPRRDPDPPRRREPEPEPRYEEPPPPVDRAPPIDRRPPRLPNPNKKSRTGRVRMSGTTRAAMQKPTSTQGAGSGRTVYTQGGRSSAEVRAEKEEYRKKKEEEAKPPALRGLDNVMSLFADLAAAQNMYKDGEKGDLSHLIDQENPNEPKRPKVKKKRKPKPPVHSKEPKRSPPPPKRPEPRSSQPPRPEPPGGGNKAGMDDLFGGGGPQEGRVRIPRRSKPKPE